MAHSLKHPVVGEVVEAGRQIKSLSRENVRSDKREKKTPQNWTRAENVRIRLIQFSGQYFFTMQNLVLETQNICFNFHFSPFPMAGQKGSPFLATAGGIFAWV